MSPALRCALTIGKLFAIIDPVVERWVPGPEREDFYKAVRKMLKEQIDLGDNCGAR